MLSSPIILYDYPQMAPESPGDFFDGTEIDEILTLRILTLTDEEKARDGRRGRAAPAPCWRGPKRWRSEQLSRLARHHPRVCGHCRRRMGMTELGPGGRPAGGWSASTSAPPRSGRATASGCGRAAAPTSWTWPWRARPPTVESIEQDYEGRVYLAVTVDDDPGKDLGALRQPGHRFFFRPRRSNRCDVEGPS